MASRGVGLPQVGRIGVSGYIALRLPLPEAVVTYFVTGSRTLIPSECTIVGTGESKGAAMLMVPTTGESDAATAIGRQAHWLSGDWRRCW